MHKKLIIFDCFGVIFAEIAYSFLNKHLPKKTVDEIKDKLFVPADLGEITYDELLSNLAEALAMPKDELIVEWEKCFIIDGNMVSIIRSLHKEADIALLSNAPSGLIEKLIESYGIGDLFDKVFVSCNLHMAKPDPEIYRHCVSQFEGPYEKIYMIDDSMKNLEPLKELGITPVHYYGMNEVIFELFD